MDSGFLSHNPYWESITGFVDRDPHLRALKNQAFVYEPSLLWELPTKTPGIYTIGGGRQIGKTTLLKQWMKYLLEQGTDPRSLFFLTGEMIPDHFTLVHIIQEYLQQASTGPTLRFLIIDEVTYIKDWDQGVKYLADMGMLEHVVMVLTGSDLAFMQEARMRFPGRRGMADKVDFHLHPLSFFEFITLKLKTEETPPTEILFQEFNNYLQHGGFLTAINSQALHGKILPSIYRTYSDWVRGDVIKRGKSESYLREFLIAVMNTYGTQVTWNSLADHTSIDHPQTIQGYAHLLESMDALFVQSALMENKLLGAPKKAKKIIVKDPFIYHAIRNWMLPSQETRPSLIPAMVEACVVSHYQRFYPCFYIKSSGEVDLAYIHDNTFFPIEVKWTQQLRHKDLQQIKKYRHGLILTKTLEAGFIGDIPTEPLPLHLYRLGQYWKEDHQSLNQFPLRLRPHIRPHPQNHR
jgi:predicted AAA+ superfamily ATPase